MKQFAIEYGMDKYLKEVKAFEDQRKEINNRTNNNNNK